MNVDPCSRLQPVCSNVRVIAFRKPDVINNGIPVSNPGEGHILCFWQPSFRPCFSLALPEFLYAREALLSFKPAGDDQLQLFVFEYEISGAGGRTACLYVLLSQSAFWDCHSQAADGHIQFIVVG